MGIKVSLNVTLCKRVNISRRLESRWLLHPQVFLNHTAVRTRDLASKQTWVRQNMRKFKKMVQDPAQCRDLVYSVFKSKAFIPIKRHPLSTDSWLPYFPPRTAKWGVRKWSGLEWVFICNAGASLRNNSLLKTTMSVDTETCLTTACIFSPSAQSVPSLWWMSNKTGQSRPGVGLKATANNSTQNPALFAAVITIWFQQNILYWQ